jgi:acetyl esterase/lipase
MANLESAHMYAQNGDAFHPDQVLDLHLPDGPGPHSLFVLIHGGGWVSGSRSDLSEHVTALVAEGWAVANLDYRLAPEIHWPAPREDAEAAVAYLRSHAKELNVRSDRIVAGGESAGANLAFWLAVSENPTARVQAVGLISPLVDLSIPMSPEGESYRIVQKVLGIDETDARYPAAVFGLSPIHCVTAPGVPVYFLQGRGDPWVPEAHTYDPAQRLEDLGISVCTDFVDTMGHCLDLQAPDELAALRRLSDWAKREIAA